MPSAFTRKWIDEGVTLVEAQNRALDFVAKQIGDDGTRPNTVVVGDDSERIHMRSGIVNAIMHRGAPRSKVKLEDSGKRYRGMSLMEIGELCCRANGIDVSGMAKMQKAGVVLGLNTRGGMHTISGLQLVAGRRIQQEHPPRVRRAYADVGADHAQSTFAPDFKNINRLQLGDAPELKLVEEHGEFTQRERSAEGKETYKPRNLRFGLRDHPASAHQRRHRRLQPIAHEVRQGRASPGSGLGVGLRSRPTPTWAMPVALFHTTHGNLAAAGTLTVARLGVARSLMRRQQGLDYQRLNIVPRYLIVPAALETLADQLTSSVLAEKSSSVNPFSGKLTVIAEPRLDDTSETQWYLAADTGTDRHH